MSIYIIFTIAAGIGAAYLLITSIFKLKKGNLDTPARESFVGEEAIKVLGIRYDFLKFFLGTFVLGVAAAVSTYLFKDAEVKIAARKAESEYLAPYLKEFLGTIDKDPDLKSSLFMAEFVSRTAVDPELKKAWTDLRNYLKVLKEKNDSTKAKVDSVTAVQKKQSESLAHQIDSLKRLKSAKGSVDNHAKIKMLEQEIKSTRDAVDRTRIEQEKILQSAANDIGATQAIPQLRPSEPQYEVIYNANRWAGEGFFNEITDEVSVYVDAFNKGEDVAIIRISIADQSSGPRRVPVGETITEEANNIKVTLRVLDYKNMGRRLSLNREVSYNIKVERLK